MTEFERDDKYDMTPHDEQILKQATEIRRRQYADKHAKRIRNLIKISRGNGPLPTDQKYPVIYADPAWKFNFSTSLNRSFENHYPTMTLDEIQALPVSKLATDDAVLFLWAISAMLPDAIDVMRAWGFSYKSHAVWVKNQVGMGFWFRNQHELLLVGTRGDMPLPIEKNRLPSVISGPRQEHSQKPARVYQIIEQMYPDLPKIELCCKEAVSRLYSLGQPMCRKGGCATDESSGVKGEQNFNIRSIVTADYDRYFKEIYIPIISLSAL